MFAHVGAVLALEVLVLAVDAFLHALEQQAVGVSRDQPVPAGAPDHLDDVPTGAAERGFQLLDDLAVAAHRAVQALQVAVDHEDQVVQPLAPGHADRTQALRLVGLAVAEEGPDLAPRRAREAVAFEVAQEARLIDRHDRPEAHRDGGELPEIRHQPGVRVGRQAVPLNFLAEVEHPVLVEPAFEEGAGVEPGRGVALIVDQVAAMRVGRRMPEVHHADVVERSRRLEAGDMATEFGGDLVGAQHGRHSVPADQAADAVLDRPVAGVARLLIGADRVQVGCIGRIRHRRPATVRFLGELRQDEVCALGSLEGQDRVECVAPLGGFQRVEIGSDVHLEIPAQLIALRCREGGLSSLGTQNHPVLRNQSRPF